MDVKIRVLKRRAANALSGHMGNAILGMLAVFAVHVAGSMLASGLFSGTDMLNIVLQQVFLFIFSLVAAIISAGMSYMYLNMARQKEHTLFDLFHFFRNEPDRVIIAAFVMALIDLIVSIPYYYYGLTADPGSNMEEELEYMLITMILLLLAQALNTILTAPFTLSFFLLSDHPDMNGIEALKQSARLMKGNILRFLLLLLSFLPMIILSVITFYIALLWVVPLMEMSRTVFYLKILEYRERERPEVITDPAGDL